MRELNENRRAGWMRQHFGLAGIDRARLREESSTTMQINFRSWRDTGITWLALQGVDVAKMQRRAGHDSISTTLGYVKAAEDLTGSIGEPFPRLPATLLPAAVLPKAKGPQGGGASGGSGVPPMRHKTRRAGVLATEKANSRLENYTPPLLLENLVGEAGFEPATTSTQSSCTTGLCDSPVNRSTRVF